MLERHRKNLVILRAGDKSLHPHWLAADRNWDIAVSYYGSQESIYSDCSDYMHYFKGSKWEGISDFIGKNTEFVLSYDRIWMPDDDIFVSAHTINRFFNMSAELDFDLSQPALSLYSYYSHKITLQHVGCLARETDFVEVMAPCFSASAFALIYEKLANNKSGWGYEMYWKRQLETSGMKIGIIDACPVLHTRPVGSAGHGGSDSPYAELEEFLRENELKFSKPVTKKVIAESIIGRVPIRVLTKITIILLRILQLKL